MTARRRRSPGDGSVFEYKLADGTVRYGIKFDNPTDDGARKQVLRRRDANGQPWLDRESAAAALREALVQVDKQEWIDPSKQPLAEYVRTWIDGLRVEPGSTSTYQNIAESHVIPYIGKVPLASVTSARLSKLYRDLEESGQRDRKGKRTGEPLSPRTVRLVHVMLHGAFEAAVNAEPPLLKKNPTDKANPPTIKEADAAAPEMHPWTASHLRKFLDWSRADKANTGRWPYMLWLLLAYTGMRRGEALALRWRDIDLDAATVSIRRSVRIVRLKGKKATLREGPTKTAKPRVIDLDPFTVAALRTWKTTRGLLALQLARDDAVVFGDEEGQFLNPESVSRRFREQQQRCARDLAADAVPQIRLHDLRHTHATILLRDRENVKIVSERLGHASVVTTLRIYHHVMPGDQRQAAARFAELVSGVGA